MTDHDIIKSYADWLFSQLKLDEGRKADDLMWGCTPMIRIYRDPYHHISFYQAFDRSLECFLPGIYLALLKIMIKQRMDDPQVQIRENEYLRNYQ